MSQSRDRLHRRHTGLHAELCLHVVMRAYSVLARNCIFSKIGITHVLKFFRELFAKKRGIICKREELSINDENCEIMHTNCANGFESCILRV